MLTPRLGPAPDPPVMALTDLFAVAAWPLIASAVALGMAMRRRADLPPRVRQVLGAVVVALLLLPPLGVMFLSRASVLIRFDEYVLGIALGPLFLLVALKPGTAWSMRLFAIVVGLVCIGISSWCLVATS